MSALNARNMLAIWKIQTTVSTSVGHSSLADTGSSQEGVLCAPPVTWPFSGWSYTLTNYSPGQRFTQECTNALDLDPAQCLSPVDGSQSWDHFDMDCYWVWPIRWSVLSTSQDTYYPPYTMDTLKYSYPTFVLWSSHTDYQRLYHLWCVWTVCRSLLVMLVLHAQIGW